METTRRRTQLSASGSVQDRLEAARRRWFVGRAGELELFRAALQSDEPPFAVLFVHGAGGVGKTALLRRYADLAADAGLEWARVDGRDIEATPAGFLTALRAGLRIDEDPGEALAGAGRAVLLIDTYESVAALDPWLREEFLPRLPGGVTVVIAGRQPPAPGWRADPGWHDLLRVLSLPNLQPAEAAEYLRAAGVAESLQPQLVGFTRGHPLALALAVDVLGQAGEDAVLDRLQAPDVVQVLERSFVDALPSPLHRHVVQVAAEARTTTEAVLRAALRADDVHELFEWLCGLSFVESGPYGLFPHDLARDVLIADLRWRDPEARQLLHRRIRAHAMSRLRALQGRTQQAAVLDFLFTEYGDPVFGAYWTQWDTMGRAFGAPATPDDRPAILAIVERHEGPESARLAAHWFDRHPDAFVVYRTGRQVAGFLCWLALRQASPEDIEADPGAHSVWRHAMRLAPPGPGEDVDMVRFLMDREAYQGASQMFNVGSVQHVLHVLGRPRLTWDFLSVADPDFWTPLWSHAGYDRTAEADFHVGGRRYAVFARDWRTAPLPPKWADLLADRGRVARPGPALDRAAYDAAVKQALRDLKRPDQLAGNPLLRSRLIQEADADRSPPDALVALLHEAAEVLRQHPRDEKLYRVIDRTYLRPAQTQERAAEVLGLPFSTYRRHLGQGVARIAAWLWQRETAG